MGPRVNTGVGEKAWRRASMAMGSIAVDELPRMMPSVAARSLRVWIRGVSDW